MIESDILKVCEALTDNYEWATGCSDYGFSCSHCFGSSEYDIKEFTHDDGCPVLIADRYLYSVDSKSSRNIKVCSEPQWWPNNAEWQEIAK